MTKQLLKEIEDCFEECQNKDWDGYGADPINKESYKHIINFVKKLPKNTILPESSPLPNGRMGLEWDISLLLSIDKKGKFYWNFLGNNKKLCGNEEEDLVKLLKNNFND